MKKFLVSQLFSVFFLFSLSFANTGSGGTLRIAGYNIQAGRGMDGKLDTERTSVAIRSLKADVVALQEVDRMTSRSGKKDQVAILAEAVGMKAVFAKAIPYQGGEYGVGVLSREEPLSHETRPLPGKREARVLLTVEFKEYVVCCTHFSLDNGEQVESSLIVNETVKRYGKPVFLIGDLNARPGSAPIKELEKELTMLSSGTLPTFPADRPRQTIDYIFGNKAAASAYKVVRATVVDEPAASDHRPVLVELARSKDQ